MFAFSQALSDPDLSVRFSAAIALDEFNHSLEQIISVFVETLMQGETFQKNLAALHLGRIGPQAVAACSALKHLIARPADFNDRWDEYLKRAVQVALDKIGCP